MAEIVHDATVVFCYRFVGRRCRTVDQTVEATRSGKQKIAEDSMASGTSKKTELKLIGVARASPEELLVDFQDHLWRHKLSIWGKEHPKAREVRALCYRKNRSYQIYRPFIEELSRDRWQHHDLPDPPDKLSAG